MATSLRVWNNWHITVGHLRADVVIALNTSST